MGRPIRPGQYAGGGRQPHRVHRHVERVVARIIGHVLRPGRIARVDAVPGIDRRLGGCRPDSSVNHRFPPEQWASGTGSLSTGPAAAGDPATLVAANQQHIFYRDAAGNIWHVYWDQRSNSRTAEPWAGPASPTGTPTAQGDPAVMEADSQQHLFYLGTDNYDENAHALHHEQWTGPVASPARERCISFGKVSPELNGRARLAYTNGTRETYGNRCRPPRQGCQGRRRALFGSVRERMSRPLGCSLLMWPRAASPALWVNTFGAVWRPPSSGSIRWRTCASCSSRSSSPQACIRSGANCARWSMRQSWIRKPDSTRSEADPSTGSNPCQQLLSPQLSSGDRRW